MFTFGATGDPLIDKWEKEIAQGIEPDLYEGLPTSSRPGAESSKSLLKKVEEGFSFDEFSDDYATMGRGRAEDFDVKDLLGRG